MTISAQLDGHFAAYARSDAPGGVVGVAHHGRVIYRRAFGMASLEHGVANATTTRLPIGSVSKHFTSAAILLLAEQGLLGLDTSIRQYLPELPRLSGEPTLRQLMMHTGGYRCYLDMAFADGFALKPAGAALATLVRQTGVNFAPGCAQNYNNSGYYLLSLAIERVSGVAFEDFLESHVFAPLGLRATQSIRNDDRVHPGIATPYVPLPEGGWRRGVNVSDERLGDGAMVSTVDDMLAWMAHLRRPDRLGCGNIWRDLQSTQPFHGQPDAGYGFGLQFSRHRGIQTLGHVGAIMGAMSHLLAVPEHELDVIVMFNRVAPAMAHALHIVDVVLGTQMSLPSVAEAPRFEEFAYLRGTYHSQETGRSFAFVEIDGVLGFSFLGGPPARLESRDSTLNLPFVLPTSVGAFAFGTDAIGCTSMQAPFVDMSDGLQQVRYERLPEGAPTAAQIAAEAQGQYRCDDAQATVTLTFKAGQLTLDCAGRYGSNTLLLESFGKDLLYVTHALMPFFAVLQLTRAGASITGLTITTGRTRQLPFKRMA